MRKNLRSVGKFSFDFPKTTTSLSFLRYRYDHRDTFPIIQVCLTVSVDTVALLQLNRDQNINGRYDGEKQMPGGHPRRRPKRDNEPEHYWMTHDLVQKRLPESQFGIFLALPIEIDLPQAEEIEMINEKCADQHRSPA